MKVWDNNDYEDKSYKYRIILIATLLTICLLTFLLQNVSATTTLECSSDNYTVSLWVGSSEWFGEVMLYTKDRQILYKKDELRVAHVSYVKKELDLEYDGDTSERPIFTVKVKGDQGYIIIHDKKDAIICDWRE